MRNADTALFGRWAKLLKDSSPLPAERGDSTGTSYIAAGLDRAHVEPRIIHCDLLTRAYNVRVTCTPVYMTRVHAR